MNNAASVLETDRYFFNSPDAGPDCICSRCLEPILKGPAIRYYPETKPPGQVEYRYHPACLGFTVVDDYDEVDYDDYHEFDS